MSKFVALKNKACYNICNINFLARKKIEYGKVDE